MTVASRYGISRRSTRPFRIGSTGPAGDCSMWPRSPLAGRGAPGRDRDGCPAADLIGRVSGIPFTSPYLSASLKQPAEADDEALLKPGFENERQGVELPVRIDADVEPALLRVEMLLCPGHWCRRPNAARALLALGDEKAGFLGGLVHQLGHPLPIGSAQPAGPRYPGALPHPLLGERYAMNIDLDIGTIFVHQPLQAGGFDVSLRIDDAVRGP